MPAAPSERERPLLSDPVRLERIRNLMHRKIHRVLFGRSPPPRGTEQKELAIVGGVSTEDVLQEAFESLLKHATFEQEDLSRDWVPLAVTIARNRAITALRIAFRGLRGTEHRPELRVVSSDALAPHDDLLPDPDADVEEQVLAAIRVEQLWHLACELLDERELRIYRQIKHQGRTRKEVGKELGLTSQRISQIYEEITRKVERHPRYPYRDE